MTSLWTSALITGSFHSHQQSTEENTLCFASFPLQLLKANKVSKSEGTRKVEYAYYFWKYAEGTYPKL